jgi:aspartate/glutamate racemase
LIEPNSVESWSDQARSLLMGVERALPDGVIQTIECLSSLGIWFRLSRNRTAFSCRDAARKRRRLGSEGIEIWNELKSWMGRYTDEGGKHHILLVHCRGDRELDLDLLRSAVGSPAEVRRLDEAEMQELGVAYGTVNPFGWCVRQMDSISVVQVFDQEVARPFGEVGTMMTNAGDHTWGVEFDAIQLALRLPGARTARIAIPDPEDVPGIWGPRERSPIVILTGNAPESGIYLWSQINERIRDLMGDLCLGDVSMPEVTVRSLPYLGLTMELDRRADAVWARLALEIEASCADGARYLVLACNTTHYFTPKIREICRKTGTEFLSMPECIGLWLRDREVRHAAIVGIPFVADLGEWSAYRLPLQGIEVEQLSAGAKARIEELAYMVKSDGMTEAGLNRLRDILRTEFRSQCVIIALTELSLLLARQRQRPRSDRLVVETLSVYAEAIACRYLGLHFPARLALDSTGASAAIT